MRFGQDARVASYVRQVDGILAAKTGVAYSDVREDLESGRHAIMATEACAALVAPADFAEMVTRRYGLASAEVPGAKALNERICALVAYATENDWRVGSDGAIYREAGDGVSRMKAGYDFSGDRYGFVTSFASGATVGVGIGGAATTSARASDFEFVGAALDLGDAAAKLEERMTSAPRF